VSAALHLIKPAVVDRASIASPALRPFSVMFRFGGKSHDVQVLAFTSCDATCTAIDTFFDGDDEMPVGGMTITVHPINTPRVA